MLNKVILMGRLTKDPELMRTQGGVNVVSFTLAVERNYAKQGEEREADFINITAFRGTAEFICKYFSKGQLVAVSGRLHVRYWEDINTNKTRSATDVIAEEVFFAEGKKDGQARQMPPAEPGEPLVGFTSSDEDLPF